MSMSRCTTLALALAISGYLLSLSARELVAAEGDAAKPFGIDKRTPWTTSRVKGSPDPPPPYKLELAFPKLRFKSPTVLTNAPGTERLFLANLEGKIYSFTNDPACEKADLVIDLAAAIPRATAVYGLAFHPQFESNRYLFVCYILGNGVQNGTRVSRFEVSRDDPPTIDPSSERRLITWASGGHNGGCLKFGPDGYLYIATGDSMAPSGPDGLDTGQDVSDLLSSILRIDVDHTGDEVKYRIPPDNPFVKTPGARGEIWAYGLRNPWKMSFDRGTGDLWLGDVGWELWEMVYRVQRGGNYGWSVMEGHQPVRPESRRGPTPILPPVVDHPHTEAASVTGGFVYHGKRLDELVGAYIYGDYVTGKIWALRYDGRQVTWHQELTDSALQIIAFGEDHAGELYVMDYERTGQIYRLEPNPAKQTEGDFPRRLSETGLFASVADHEPAAGVTAYDINAPRWADHAVGSRLLALPGDSQIQFSRDGSWKVPAGSVLVKTLELQMKHDDASSLRRIETQLLHFEDDTWRPYSYRWNDDQTDATLVDADGAVRKLNVADSAAPQGVREQTWRFASRTECASCHNPAAENLLAFNASQLNREHHFGGVRDNQIRTWDHIGLFTGALPEPADGLPKLTSPDDASADLNDRVRSYLHVNCAHCHRSGGGGTATIQLLSNMSLDQTRMIGIRPTQGAFGISSAGIVSPGDPLGSVLYYRIANIGSGRMPRIGSRLVDQRALEMIRRWIAHLPAQADASSENSAVALLGEEDRSALRTIQSADTAASPELAAATGRLVATTRGGLALMHLVDEEHLPDDVRQQVVTVAAGKSDANVRDLFERFLPESARTKRLGSVIRPDDILQLSGDAGRGKHLFFNSSAVQCKNCHRIGHEGEPLGPDLTQIAKTFNRSALLETILEPSKKIDPEFVSYLLETVEGQIIVGLLAKRTDQEVVLKSADRKLIHVAADDVELLLPQSKSLMPELLLRDLTAQQVADLLEFLLTLK